MSNYIDIQQAVKLTGKSDRTIRRYLSRYKKEATTLKVKYKPITESKKGKIYISKGWIERVFVIDNDIDKKEVVIDKSIDNYDKPKKNIRESKKVVIDKKEVVIDKLDKLDKVDIDKKSIKKEVLSELKEQAEVSTQKEVRKALNEHINTLKETTKDKDKTINELININKELIERARESNILVANMQKQLGYTEPNNKKEVKSNKLEGLLYWGLFLLLLGGGAFGSLYIIKIYYNLIS